MTEIFVKLNSKFHKFQINNTTYNICLKTSNNKKENLQLLIGFIKKKGLTEKNIISFCLKNFSFFTILIWNKNYVLAAVDQISSYPLIYKNSKNQIKISDDIVFFKNEKINEDSLKQIKYAGYTLENNTVYEKVYGLRPLEYIFNKKKIYRKKIFKKYKIKYKKKSNLKIKEDKLTTIFLKIFKEIKNRNRNCKIFVPLSAGYDSRVIISLLLKVGTKNIETFTYGRKNVRDFMIAKKISKKLGVINHPIYITNKLAKECYEGRNFLKYLNFFNSGNSPNNFGDFIAIQYLIKNEIMKKGDVVINGQTGDYISGNHIPTKFKKKKYKSIKNYLDFIIEKHFNLIGNKLFDKNQIKIRNEIRKIYFKNLKNKNENYEFFEFVNRQVKWVVSQQKVYDYFHLNWELPFWDRRIIKFFFRDITLKDRINQNFFKGYLNKKNFSNIWKIEINPKQTFSIFFYFIRIIFKLIFILNKQKWHDFEKKYLNYFLDTSLSTMFVKYTDFVKNKSVPRNSILFFSRHYVNKTLKK